MAKFGPKMASRNVFRTLQIKTHFRHSRFSFYHRSGSSVTHMGTRLRRALYGDASQVHNFFQKCKIVASRCLFSGRICSRISDVGGGDVQLGGREGVVRSFTLCYKLEPVDGQKKFTRKGGHVTFSPNGKYNTL